MTPNEANSLLTNQPRLHAKAALPTCSAVIRAIACDNKMRVVPNRPVSHSNGWTGSSMKWRLMRANLHLKRFARISLHFMLQAVAKRLRHCIENSLLLPKTHLPLHKKVSQDALPSCHVSCESRASSCLLARL